MANIVKKEVYSDLATIKKQEELMVALNQEPPATWVKLHPFISDYKYLPIERVEFLLKSLFKNDYKIEVLKTGLLLNCVEVTVRIHYKDPFTTEWKWHDGVGASEIQTKKNTGHLQLDMSNINRGAIVMALPNAKSVAIKDAADHLGKLFGSDLNRKDVIAYGIDLTLISMDEKHPNWNKVVEAVKSKTYSVADIKEKYDLTTESEETLIKLQNGTV